MSDQRVAILDGSHSVFDSSISDSPSASAHETVDDGLGLKPIPRFEEIVKDAARTATSGDVQPGKVAVIDVGIICDTSVVRDFAKTIHARVWQQQSLAG